MVNALLIAVNYLINPILANTDIEQTNVSQLAPSLQQTTQPTIMPIKYNTSLDKNKSASVALIIAIVLSALIILCGVPILLRYLLIRENEIEMHNLVNENTEEIRRASIDIEGETYIDPDFEATNNVDIRSLKLYYGQIRQQNLGAAAVTLPRPSGKASATQRKKVLPPPPMERIEEEKFSQRTSSAESKEAPTEKQKLSLS